MTTSSEGPPLYTGHLPMNRLFLTTATPSQWHSNLSVSQLQRDSSYVKGQFRKIFDSENPVGFTSLKNWCWETCQLYITKEWVKFLQYLIKGRYEKWFNFCSLLVQSRLGCFSQASLFVCLLVCFVLFCFVFSNLFIFIVIVMRWCHHKHVWRVVKLKPSVHGVKYLTLDLDFL